MKGSTLQDIGRWAEDERILSPSSSHQYYVDYVSFMQLTGQDFLLTVLQDIHTTKGEHNTGDLCAWAICRLAKGLSLGHTNDASLVAED
jgi:hypothetical protein